MSTPRAIHDGPCLYDDVVGRTNEPSSVRTDSRSVQVRAHRAGGRDLADRQASQVRLPRVVPDDQGKPRRSEHLAGRGLHRTVSVELLARPYPARTGHALGAFDTLGTVGGVVASSPVHPENSASPACVAPRRSSSGTVVAMISSTSSRPSASLFIARVAPTVSTASPASR